MVTMALKHDIGRLYGECILYWILENDANGQHFEDHEMQEGSGLPDVEFRIGLNWLMNQNLLDYYDDLHH